MSKLPKLPVALAALIITLLVSILVWLFSLTPLQENLSLAVSDVSWRRFLPAGEADTNVVVVTIDQKSLEIFSSRYAVSWPWPRQFYAKVLDYLTAAGARGVLFDVLLEQPESGRLDVPGGSSDAELAQALSRNGRAVLAATVRGPVDCPEEKYPDPGYSGGKQLPASCFQDFVPPLSLLADSAAGVGVANFLSDVDGICRRLPFFFRVGDRLLPSLALATFLTGEKLRVDSYDPQRRVLHLGDRSLSLDRNGFHRIRWYGPGGENGVFRYYSFHSLLLSAVHLESGREPPVALSAFRDKYVIICASAAGLSDLRPTPFTSLAPYPGGEIYATMISNLLQGETVRSLPVAPLALLLLLVLYGLSFIFLKHSMRLSLLLAVLLLLLLGGVNLWLFHYHVLVFDLVSPVLAVLLTTSGAATYRVLTEDRARRQLRHVFSRYLADDVINILIQDPERIDLEGAEIEGTVLFTDLQGFTTFAEERSPKEVIRILNRYFDTLTSIILDAGGLVDKYTGDGVMAVFGAPLPRDDHARLACEAVLAMRERNINGLIPAPGGDIITRMGVSSGPMIVGNLGTERKMDYTAVGDTVNLSARLEGVNKTYGTTNMFSEFTVRPVIREYLFREVDIIRVKGKRRPIRVYTLLGRMGSFSPWQMETEDLFQDGRELYGRRDWSGAEQVFAEVLRRNPQDGPAHAFLVRCRHLQRHPELVDEQGVFTFTVK